MRINMTWIKYSIYYLALIFFLAIFLELLSFSASHLLIKNVYGYPQNIFDGVSYQNDSEFGWIEKYGLGQPRPSPSNSELNHTEPCVYVFGDSFAHADEVEDDQAWSFILQSLLGCNVANYGVGGYGSDQAFLMLDRMLPDLRLSGKKSQKVVLFGVYQEMLRRNQAASWLFYCCPDKKNSIKPYFYFDENLNALKLQDIPKTFDPETVKIHHLRDAYFQLSEIKFPFTMALIKTALFRLNAWLFDVSILQSWRTYSKTAVKNIQYKIMEAAVKTANERGFEVGFVIFPTTNDAFKNKRRYEQFIDELPISTKDGYDFFVIDLLSTLHHQSNLSGKPLRAPGGHYDATGNRLIGSAIYNELSPR